MIRSKPPKCPVPKPGLSLKLPHSSIRLLTAVHTVQSTLPQHRAYCIRQHTIHASDTAQAEPVTRTGNAGVDHSRVRIGLRFSGSSSAVWVNSATCDLCTVIANTVSTACNRLGITQRILWVPSPARKATRDTHTADPSASVCGICNVMPISPFIRRWP